MNEILLVTTKGCAACRIMRNSIIGAINESHKSITFKESDVKETDAMFLKSNNVFDYPTTFFIKDGKVKYRYSGTTPIIVVLRWIDIHFK